ncbi:hypothetical protein GCM10023187_15890 [Nibrella viscosa]|uniref:DUF5916 domain-containing protein n=1 Tax=Nibrella viscosa TaxID=1084524 RepID=A0ABP8K866_9BACT
MKYLYLLFIAFFTVSAFAQTLTINEQTYQLHIRKARFPLNLDGQLQESDWKLADTTTVFWQNTPFDTSRAWNHTQVRVTFDDQFLYVGAVCYQARHRYVVQSLKRDFPGGSSDVFVVNIDTYRDKQNSFNFALSPYGVQREGLVSGGTTLSTDWDNKWFSKVRNYDDRWELEMAIPFKTLRYKPSEGQNVWNINFTRNVLADNERSSWAPISRNFNGNNIAFSGLLVWDDRPPTPGANVVLIPYLSGNGYRDYVRDIPTQTRSGLGFDAKIGITPALNLDLTVNPDFSQVEVDRQVTNLSRFELLFPERRQFFLENSDLFGQFGFNTINPFFSRRIGIVRSPNTGDNLQVPIMAGARLSGKLTNKWRVGLLSMQTNRNTEIGLPTINYTVAAVQRQIFTRSGIGFILVNKQVFAADTSERTGYQSQYNRVAGLDYNLNSKDGRWTNKFFYHRVMTPVATPGQYAMGAFINYNTPELEAESRFEHVGDQYTAETGYVPRRGYYRAAPNIAYSIYPKNPRLARVLNRYGVGVDGDIFIRRTDGLVTDWDATPVYLFARLQNTSSIRWSPWRMDYTYLFSDFNPTNTKGLPLKAGTAYRYASTRLTYQSDTRRLLNYILQARVGQYFNGNIVSITSTFNYRYQPYGVLSLDVNYNQITLPKPYSSAMLLLIGPRVELSFSRNVFLTTFVQYNNQINNVNVNARFQWRFRPVSDLFIVYTDNYVSDTFQSKNRALVLKMTYWLNV